MKKWDNFQASLKNLSAIYDEKPPYDVVTLTGMVALFQICFEQSWKAMKGSSRNRATQNLRWVRQSA